MSSVKRENTVADPGAKGSKESARDAWPLSVQIRSFWCRLTPPPQGWRHRLGSPGSATETLPVSFKVGNKNTFTLDGYVDYMFGDRKLHIASGSATMQRVDEARASNSEKMSENRIQLVLSTMSVSFFKTRFY